MSNPGTNTSATGGQMRPDDVPVPLEGNALLDLFQETFVALTGLDTTLVRPSFQMEPANMPDQGTAWMAFDITRRPADVNPVIVHDPLANAGVGQDNFQRQEELRVRCSFFDTGVGGRAYELAALLRDCICYSQNIWPLQENNIVLGYVEEIEPAPVLIKTMWQFRVDLTICFRRQVDRVFRTQNILVSDIDIHYGGAGDGNAAIGQLNVGGTGIEDTEGDKVVHVHVPPPQVKT